MPPAAARQRPRRRPATPVALVVGIAVAALAACVLGGWLARRAGLRLPARAGAVEATEAAAATRAIEGPDPRSTAAGHPRQLARGRVRRGGNRPDRLAHACCSRRPRRRPGRRRRWRDRTRRWPSNPDLDPGTSLSEVAPNFTLTDQFGQPVSLSSYRGKVVILAFNDSECTTVCPLTTAALVDAKAMLGSAASRFSSSASTPTRRRPRSTTCSPTRELHGMLYQWQYLTGSLPQLESVWKDYSVGVDVNQNQVDHEPAIFVINQQGRLEKLYLTQLAYSAVPQLGQLLANEVATPAPRPPRRPLAPVLRAGRRDQPGLPDHPARGGRRVRQPRARPARPGEPGAAVPVLRHLGPGDHQPRRPARRAQRVPVRRGRRPPARADRD